MPSAATLSVAMESLPIIAAMGVSVYELVWSQKWHVNTRAELISVSRGNLSVIFDDVRMDLKIGDMAFVPPHVRHRDHFDAGDEPDATGNRPRKLAERARRYIDTHYNEPLSLDRMADYLRVSTYYLSHVFNQESGFSVKSYLTTVRMEHAWNRLRNQTGNVSEVAYAVGYESSAYFSRIFKKHFGVAPSEIELTAAPERK